MHLLSFKENLTDIEIERFVNELDRVVQEQDYSAAFQMAIDKIREYPTCDKLVYASILYLDGALSLYCVPEPEQYRETFETFYKRLSVNEMTEIRDTAISMLISYARNRGEYAKAEELIHMLPVSMIDREEQLAVLYQQQKKYADAEKIWEHRLLNGVTKIQLALMNMLEIALHENRNTDAEFFADMYKTITRQFCFPEWMRYNAHLLLAIDKKNKDECLSILKKMLPAMKKEWNVQDCQLYRNAKDSESTLFSSRLADTLCDELATKEEYAFVRDCAEFRELMAQITG